MFLKYSWFSAAPVGSLTCLTGWEMSGIMLCSGEIRHLRLDRKDNWTRSLMSSWARPAPFVSSTSRLHVFARLQPGLLLCSGIYKNSPETTKRCQAWSPENTGYLISAVKVSRAEFNKKSKVAKLDENYRACDPSVFVWHHKLLHHTLVCEASWSHIFIGFKKG